MPLEMQGFDDLENDLTNMAAALEFGSGVDRALQAGAKPIEEQMLHNASTDPKIITGALHDSIHTGKVKHSPEHEEQGEVIHYDNVAIPEIHLPHKK